MTSLEPGRQDVAYPLLPWSARSGVEREQVMAWLPELHLTVGYDKTSAGLTVSAWLPTGGHTPAYTTLWSRRWKSKCQSTQELMEVAYRGLAAALAELFDLDVGD